LLWCRGAWITCGGVALFGALNARKVKGEEERQGPKKRTEKLGKKKQGSQCAFFSGTK